MKKLIFFLIVLFTAQMASAVTCTGSDGDWEDNSTWSCGVVPGCGDSIVIPAGVTVTITTQLDYLSLCVTPPIAMKIVIYGELHFQNGKKLQLPCGSIISIMPGGSITPGGGGGNANLIDICGVTLWTSDDGPLFGPLTLPNNPLPVELLNFKATQSGRSTILNWSTATETNNDYYSIERSINGSNYIVIGTVDGAGNSNTVLNYSYIDDNPIKGTSYYRLKQTDFDGNFKYSSIVSININDADYAPVLVYPNPCKGVFYVEGNESNVEIMVYHPVGKIILKKILETGKTSIDLSDMNNGIYILHINSENGSKIQRLSILK